MKCWAFLRRRLETLPGICRAAANEAARLSALEARDAAQALAPVHTGKLRRSIEAEGASVVCRCDYGAAVELGSAERPARPFMEPAARNSGYFERAAALAKEGLSQ